MDYIAEQEKKVLGYMIQDACFRTEALDTLISDDFTTPFRKEVFQRISDMVSKAEEVDLVSVCKYFPGRGSDVSDFSSSWADYNRPSMKDVIENTKLRELRKIVETAGANLKRPGIESEYVIEDMEKSISQISLRKSTELQSLENAWEKMNIEYERRKTQGAFVKSGFNAFDRISGGLRPGQFVVLGSRPSLGKTSLALSMASKIGVEHGVGIVSLEMSADELMERLVAGAIYVNLNKLRRSDLNELEYANYVLARERLECNKIVICDSPWLTFANIKSVARKMVKTKDVSVIFIDYIGLIRQTNRNQSRFDFISELSRDLKLLARELNICVVALSQLNRLAEGSQPSLAHLRESGSLEQDADMVIFLHRDRDMPEEGVHVMTDLIIAKNRSGQTGYFQIAFQPEQTTFFEVVNA